MGLQLAHAQNGGELFSAALVSKFEHVDGLAVFGTCAVRQKNFLQSPAVRLERTLHLGRDQHADLACAHHFGRAKSVEWAGGHLGLHHADFLCLDWRGGLWGGAPVARLVGLGGGFAGCHAFDVARIEHHRGQTAGCGAGAGGRSFLGLGHATNSAHPHSGAHTDHRVLDDLHEHLADEFFGLCV